MKPGSSLTVALLVAVAGLPACRGVDTPPESARSTPDPCAVALAPSAPRDDADRRIALLQEQARSGADTRHALEQLGYRLVARARARSDEGSYTLAEKAAECLSSRYPDDASALLLRGHVLHQLHRFSEAEQLARRLTARRSFVLDYGLLGDALMEQGRLAEAADAYQKMIDLKPFYQSYTRGAHLRWLKGDLDGAIRLMRMAVGAASPRDPESAAWASSRLALYELQQGRLAEAARAADAALEHLPEYPAALLARGRILLAMQRPTEGRDVLRRAAELQPLPEYQWALADALRLTGLEGDAATVEQRLTADGGRADRRTLALFLATRGLQPADAVALAEAEMKTRGDVFTLDALAWALAAAGRVQEAEAIMKRALAEGTQEGRLFLHAAAIAAAAGRENDARRWATRAETLRSMLLPSELDELARVRRRIVQPATGPTGVSGTQEN